MEKLVGHQKDTCHYEIGLCAQKLGVVLDSLGSTQRTDVII